VTKLSRVYGHFGPRHFGNVFGAVVSHIFALVDRSAEVSLTVWH